MKLRVRDVNIATGGPLIAIMHHKDALEGDFHYEDRILITHGKRSAIAELDIAESDYQLPHGQIGLMEEVLDKLGVKNGESVEVKPERTPQSVHYIKEKLDGHPLTAEKIDQIIQDVVANRLTPIEMTYFVAACYTRNLSKTETIALTKSIVKNGDIFKPGSRIVVDKHCIGGVPGNRTTMVVVPLIAAAGLTIPKTSSRSITSPAGTADSMEVLAEVSIPIQKLRKIIKKVNACMIWGGAFGLAAADDKLIRLRHPLSLDPVGMVLASVLAKKKAVSATHVLIDIPTGRGAKIETRNEALKYKNLFEDIGTTLGMKVKTIITDGSEPIGNGIGPGLEARDVLWVLKNDKRAPTDLVKKSLEVAGMIYEMVGRSKKGEGRKLAEQILQSGKGYKKMVQIIKAQGPKITDPSKIKLGKFKAEIRAEKSGKIRQMDNKTISKIAWMAGAPVDKAAGLYLYKHCNDTVSKNESLYTLYSDSREKLKYAAALARKSTGMIIR